MSGGLISGGRLSGGLKGLLVSDSGPPNFRSIRLGPNPKLTLN